VSRIVRVLSAYERDPGDAFVGEWPLEGIELADLQALFGVPADDPMSSAFRSSSATPSSSGLSSPTR
jgi:hypothetical protein